MGGGFGSKFGADVWGLTAAELSKKAGKPVRMFLDRVQEHLAAGNRPSATGHVKLGANKDGKLVAMVAETHGTGGSRGGSQFPLPYVYDVPNASRSHTDVFVNAGDARAMRAPGHPQGCAIMEAAMDDLADKLGIDPLEMRLKNLPEDDFRTADLPGRGQDGGRADRLEQDRKPRGQNGKGPIKRGLGMALHQWGGGGAPGQAGHLHDQPRRLRRGEERHPGHRHRRPDHPGDHRRRGARPEGRPTSGRTSATRPSPPARPRAGRRPPRR